MLARLARADRATHDLGKVACGPQRPLAPCRNNRCCNCLSKPFFPIGANHLPELFFVGAREVLRSGLAARGVHAHVERSLAREAETARGVVELGRGDAQIQQDSGHLADSASG